MKTFMTLTAVAALVAGMSIANAQNAGGAAPPGASPSNINKGADDGKGTSQSGNESSKTAAQPAKGKDKKVVGNGQFCMEMSGSDGLECRFTSLDACVKEGKPNGRNCSQNPNLGTTGSKTK